MHGQQGRITLPCIPSWYAWSSGFPLIPQAQTGGWEGWVGGCCILSEDLCGVLRQYPGIHLLVQMTLVLLKGTFHMWWCNIVMGTKGFYPGLTIENAIQPTTCGSTYTFKPEPSTTLAMQLMNDCMIWCPWDGRCHSGIAWTYVIKWKHFLRYWPFVRGFDVYFDLLLNKRLSKQSWGWWFETPSCPSWWYCNALRNFWRRRIPTPVRIGYMYIEYESVQIAQDYGCYIPQFPMKINNSLSPGAGGFNLKSVIYKCVVVITSCVFPLLLSLGEWSRTLVMTTQHWLR